MAGRLDDLFQGTRWYTGELPAQWLCRVTCRLGMVAQHTVVYRLALALQLFTQPGVQGRCPQVGRQVAEHGSHVSLVQLRYDCMAQLTILQIRAGHADFNLAWCVERPIPHRIAPRFGADEYLEHVILRPTWQAHQFRQRIVLVGSH
ncbi:hypothetical protein D3C76_1137590 [compost metagenome]